MANDARKKITTSDLHMNSGLEESYDKICATQMLFQAANMGRVQLEKEYEPNTHWNYSSGTTNLLSYI
jgi:CubicO group peptidase (beta-lactamase class C family)